LVYQQVVGLSNRTIHQENQSWLVYHLLDIRTLVNTTTKHLKITFRACELSSKPPVTVKWKKFHFRPPVYNGDARRPPSSSKGVP